MDVIRTHSEVYLIQHKLIKCVSDLQQVGGFLLVLGSEKLIQIQYVLRQTKHFNYSVKIPKKKGGGNQKLLIEGPDNKRPKDK